MEEDPPSMAVAPPKRISLGPWDLVAATAVSVWPHRGPGVSSSVSQKVSKGRYIGAGYSHGFDPITKTELRSRRTKRSSETLVQAMTAVAPPSLLGPD